MEQFTKNVASKHSTPMIDKVNPDKFISGETVADEAYFNDGGSWTSLAIADTFSEIGTTGVYEIDLTASERNHDQIIIKMTSANSQDNAIKINAIPAPANMKEIEEALLSGNNATFNLKQLNVINSNGDAIVGKSTGNNGDGLSIAGNGFGHGSRVLGGLTGHGYFIKGGLTSGSAISLEVGGSNETAFLIRGKGTGKDIDAFEIDILGYPNGQIVYNPGATTNTGTVLGTDGTTDKPVTTMAAALNLVGQLKTRKMLVVGPTGESINGANMEDIEFRGSGRVTLTGITVGPSLSGSRFYGIQLNGLWDAENAEFYDCFLASPNALSNWQANFYSCGFFSGTWACGNEGQGSLFEDCYTLPLEDVVITDDGNLVEIHGWRGELTVDLLQFGDALIYMISQTFLKAASINAVGTTYILRGLGNFENNSGGSIPDVTEFVDVSDIDSGDESFYPDGFIYMSTTASNVNTVLRVDGTFKKPVSTLAAAKTLAEALGSKMIKILGAGALTLPAGSWNNFEIVGQTNFFNLGLDLTGSTPLNTTFRNFTINGTHNTANRNRFISCLMNSVKVFGDCIECAFNTGPITLDDCRLIDCYPQNLVTTTLAVNLSSDVNIIRWGGNLKIGAVSAGGSLDINLQGGELELTSAFNGGIMKATGYGKFTDNKTSGTVVVDNFLEITDIGDLSSVLGTDLTETTAGNFATNVSTFYDNADSLTSKIVDEVGGSGASASEVADAVWDELRAGHIAAGSFGENVNSNLVKIGGSPSVDGLAVVTMFENLIARAQGDVERTGNAYTYKKQNGSTTAFTYTITSGGRT